MSRPEERLQAMRAAVTAKAAQMGISIQHLPSGLYHLRGKGLDLKVLDLANVHRNELDYRA